MSGVGPGFWLRSLCGWWDRLLSAGTLGGFAMFCEYP